MKRLQAVAAFAWAALLLAILAAGVVAARHLM